MIMKASLVTTAAALLLAGCGGAKDGAAGGNASSAAVASSAPVALTAKGTPRRADGRWELKHVGGGGSVVGTQILCVDAASEEKAPVFDGIAKNLNCSKYDIAPSDGGWAFEFICGAAGMTSTTKGSVTGDFTSAYKIEMTQSDGTVELGRTIEARHTGACPADMKPGTLTDDQGKVVADITR